jgi:hypothetical protein
MQMTFGLMLNASIVSTNIDRQKIQILPIMPGSLQTRIYIFRAHEVRNQLQTAIGKKRTELRPYMVGVGRFGLDPATLPALMNQIK